MTVKLIISILIPSMLSLAACAGEDQGAGAAPDPAPTAKGVATVPGSESAPPVDPALPAVSALGLKLDDGKKWKANEATQVGMGKIAELLTAFAGAAAKDHVALGKSLQEETMLIVQKCTMKGESHDQLHLVLNPMLETIYKLADGNGGEAECKALRELLDEYDAHFEV